jgi:hypothetical protein
MEWSLIAIFTAGLCAGLVLDRLLRWAAKQ